MSPLMKQSEIADFARRLCAVPITRENYSHVAELIMQPVPSHEDALDIQPDGTWARPNVDWMMIISWMLSDPEYASASLIARTLIYTNDWADLVASVVARWQRNREFWRLWYERQRALALSFHWLSRKE